MSLPTPHAPATPIAFHATGQQYRQTTSFIYLGGAISESPKLTAEVDCRIRAGWMSFNRYRQELYDRPTASLDLKTRMVKSEVVEVLLHMRDVDSAKGRTDVKPMCINHAKEHGILWDWCVSHVSSKAFEHAFGTSAEPSKSKNQAARDVIKAVIKVMEKLNRSSTWRAKFDDILVEDLGLCLKFLKHAPQRWLSLSKTLECVIRLWHPLKKLLLNDGQAFPLEVDGKKEEILELYSLMAPVADIMRDGQHGSLPMNGETHMALSLLHVTLLSEDESLKVFQIPPLLPAGTQTKTSAKLPFVSRANDDITDVGRATRGQLRNAFVSRFTARAWDTHASDPSFFRDAVVVLVPPFSKAKHLDMLKLKDGDEHVLSVAKKGLVPTTAAEVEAKRNEVWHEIRRRAFQAALALDARNEDMAEVRKAKRAKVSAAPASSEKTSTHWALFEDDEGESADPDSPEAMEARASADAYKVADDEIQRFKVLKATPGSFPPRDALVFWKGSAIIRLPKLWRVAQQVFGNQASAAQIERDFGGAGQLLSSRRSRIDSMHVEMLLFLHLNFNNIPQDVPAIKSDALNTFPKRFIGTDVEFDEAMQFVTGGDTAPEVDAGGGSDTGTEGVSGSEAGVSL